MQENAKLVQDVYEAFGRGDIAFIMERLDEHVEWICYGPSSVPFTGTFKGRANVIKFFEALGTTQTNPKLTIDETHIAGNEVISLGSYSGMVAATKKTFDSKIAHFFTVKNGKIVRFLDFIDTAHAVEAYTPPAAVGSAA